MPGAGSTRSSKCSGAWRLLKQFAGSRNAPDGWRIAEALRKNIRFQVHNLLEMPPHPGSFDIVLCRNVLLYLCAEKKALAFDRLAASMAEDGYFMLGAGETVIGQTKKLAADPKTRGLYRLDHRSDRRAGEDRRNAAQG